MAISDYVPTLTPGRLELDEFLSAPICDEQNGMTLSVISAMARLGIDPWSEAARLASLPRTNAAAMLASLINRLFAGAPAAPDAASIASRLVKLLPERVTTARAPRRQALEPVAQLWAEITWQRVGLIVVVAAVIAYFLL